MQRISRAKSTPIISRIPIYARKRSLTLNFSMNPDHPKAVPEVPPQNQYRCIAIEGNIGCGKSTLLASLKQRFDYLDTEAEPVLRWQNCGGFNLLQQFYSDPVRNCYLLQSYIALTFAQIARKPCPFNYRVVERSFFSSWPFITVALERQTFSPVEFALVEEIHEIIGPSLKNPDMFIFLHVDPEVAYERLRSRGRAEESTVPLDYLQAIHNCMFEKWLPNLARTNNLERSAIQMIDANRSPEAVLQDVIRVIENDVRRNGIPSHPLNPKLRDTSV